MLILGAGPVALIIGGQVPLGVGFALEAKSEVANIGFDAFVEGEVSAAFGFDRAVGWIGEFDNRTGGFFKPRLPASLGEVRNEAAVSVYGYATLQIGNPWLNALQFKAVEIKAGLQQKAELASEKAQADDTTYTSKFTLSPVLEAKTTSEVSALANLLNIQLVEWAYAPVLPVLARSPRGTFTIAPDTVAPGQRRRARRNGHVHGHLDTATYLGEYAVEAIEIRWLKDDGTGTMTLQPGPPGCTTITPAASGQMVFTCQSDFLSPIRESRNSMLS